MKVQTIGHSRRVGLNMKKALRGILILTVMAAFLAGCGTRSSKIAETSNNGNTVEDTNTVSEAAAGEDTSLADIKAKGKLVLGLDDAFPPMGFTDDQKQIVGFDIDLAKEVTKRMGVELVLQPISWEAKEAELSTKNIDCIWNGLSYNEERAQTMTLSAPYMKNKQVAVVLADSSVNTLADLAGKTVVIQNGSTASDAMDANEEFKNSLKELIKVDDNVQALLDLKTSGSDAVVMDEVVARYYTEKEQGTYKVLDESLADEDYVVGFRKGDLTLCAEVEKYLKEMAEDGTLAKISNTWFGTDITTIK
jgi:polar amino acid transport system substrate-binding protein